MRRILGDRSNPERSPGVHFPLGQRSASAVFLAASFVILIGCWIASQEYPGGFDWVYSVASALASTKHNPNGAEWCSGSIGMATLIVLPLILRLRDTTPTVDRSARVWISFVIAGMTGTMLVSLEMFVGVRLDSVIPKGHEVLTIATFLCLYLGILGLHFQRWRRKPRSLFLVIGAVLPILGIGTAELLLYLDQRHLGWVNRDWRRLGIPVWMSFAFWQWLAILMLWGNLGWLATFYSRTRVTD